AGGVDNVPDRRFQRRCRHCIGKVRSQSGRPKNRGQHALVLSPPFRPDTIEKGAHGRVVGQDESQQSLHLILAGGRGQGAKEKTAEPSTVVFVDDGQGYLGSSWIIM